MDHSRCSMARRGRGMVRGNPNGGKLDFPSLFRTERELSLSGHRHRIFCRSLGALCRRVHNQKAKGSVFAVRNGFRPERSFYFPSRLFRRIRRAQSLSDFCRARERRLRDSAHRQRAAPAQTKRERKKRRAMTFFRPTERKREKLSPRLQTAAAFFRSRRGFLVG